MSCTYILFMPVFLKCIHPFLYCTWDISEMLSLKMYCFNRMRLINWVLGLANCSKWMCLILKQAYYFTIWRSLQIYFRNSADQSFFWNYTTRKVLSHLFFLLVNGVNRQNAKYCCSCCEGNHCERDKLFSVLKDFTPWFFKWRSF